MKLPKEERPKHIIAFLLICFCLLLFAGVPGVSSCRFDFSPLGKILFNLSLYWGLGFFLLYVALREQIAINREKMEDRSP